MTRQREAWTGEMSTSSSFFPAVVLGDISVPQSVSWHIDGDPVTPGRGWPDVTARFEMRDGVPTCVDFHVTCKPGARGITTGNLRTFDLEKIAERAFLLHAMAATPDGPLSPIVPDLVRHAEEALSMIHKAGSQRWAEPLAELREVARVYLTPKNRGEQRKAVARWLGVEDSTASRRIKSAREMGLIPPKGAGEHELRAALQVLDEETEPKGDDRG